MATAKATLYVSKNFTLNRPGKDPVAFTAGRNIVDADLADHPYVKAHLTDTDIGATNDGALAALQAAQERIAELEAQVAKLQADMEAMAAAYAHAKPAKK